MVQLSVRTHSRKARRNVIVALNRDLLLCSGPRTWRELGRDFVSAATRSLGQRSCARFSVTGVSTLALPSAAAIASDDSTEADHDESSAVSSSANAKQLLNQKRGRNRKPPSQLRTHEEKIQPTSELFTLAAVLEQTQAMKQQQQQQQQINGAARLLLVRPPRHPFTPLT